MGWFGSSEWHLFIVVLWGMMAIVWMYGYIRGNKTRSETTLFVAMATVWISYSINEAATLLSLSPIIPDVLSIVGFLIFVVLVIYWFRTRTDDQKE